MRVYNLPVRTAIVSESLISREFLKTGIKPLIGIRRQLAEESSRGLGATWALPVCDSRSIRYHDRLCCRVYPRPMNPL